MEAYEVIRCISVPVGRSFVNNTYYSITLDSFRHGFPLVKPLVGGFIVSLDFWPLLRIILLTAPPSDVDVALARSGK